MIKKFILSISLLFSLASIAQEGTASPYSFYGIGEVRFKGTIENRLMGGLSILPDSIHLNIQNPASYAGLKLTTFSVAGSFSASKLRTATVDDKAQRTTLDYLAVGVPIGKKFGASFGLIPYSSVGYKIKSSKIVDNISQESTYNGSGGLNKVYVALAYKVNKNFSVGADLNYNFGTIEAQSYTSKEKVELITSETRNSEMSGVNFNFGAMYQTKISPKLEAYSSFVFSPSANLKTTNSLLLSALSASGVTYQANDVIETETTLKMPTKVSFGVGVGQARKWMFGAEITSQQSSNFTNRFSDYTKGTYENVTKYSFGGYYLPNYNSFTDYYKKVTYRAGLRFENTGLVIFNESIKEQAASLGFGFPLGGTFSNLNIGAELGKRGTAKANLVQENFLNVMISLSLNDLWFVKRKYD